jgi:SAM-dependent methyltransferase
MTLMRPKPTGLGAYYAAQFNDPSVVAAYDTRPRYPDALFALLRRLGAGKGRNVLDLGCGTGEIARRLAPSVAAITAVDCAERMITRARTLAGGQAPNIEWVAAHAEELPITKPFSLVIAAESFHWFDWDRLCPRLAAQLPAARLVLVEDRCEVDSPWGSELQRLIAAYSTNCEFEPYDIVDELTYRGYLDLHGRQRLGPYVYTQSVDDYVRSIHSRNGFSLDRMSREAADAFDGGVRELVQSYATRSNISLRIETRVAYGRIVVT